MGIREWLRRHQVDPDPSHYDEELHADRTAATDFKQRGQEQIAEIREIKLQSGKVHREMKKLREDNHFAPALFRWLTEGPRR